MTKKLITELSKYSIPFPKGNVDDHRIHRWGNNNRYWVKRFDGGYVFGDFVTDLNAHVFDDDNCDFKARREIIEKAKKEIEEDQRKSHEEAAENANNIWKMSVSVSNHGYLENKKMKPYGIRKNGNEIVIPLCDETGKIWSLQFIDESGKKRFLSGGRKKGCFFIVDSANKIEKPEIKEIFICEGYATGSTIHECTASPVVVAFDAGNLRDVCKAIRKKYKDKKIVICSDNDQYSENGLNTGLEKAITAAKEIDAYVVKPVFSDVSTKPTDFNDLFLLEGLDKVKKSIYSYDQAVKPALAELYLNKYNNIYSSIKNFLLSEGGLFYINPKTKEEFYICDYINIVSLTEDVETRKTGRLAEFKTRRNQIKKLNILDEWLSKDGDLIRAKLMSAGFKISTENFARRKFNEYVNLCESDQYAKYVRLTGWNSGCFLTPSGIIGNNSSSILLNQSDTEDAYVCEKGTLDEWKEKVAKYCAGNSRLILSVSFSFASLLIKPCSRENCGVHFVGESSQGKTSSLYMAASVFGSPEYIKTWRSTDNALEGLAVSHNDMLLILDEMAEMDPKKIGEAAYMLCNGKGKSRLTSSISLRKHAKWRLGVLSTGEIDITTHMESGGKKSRAGQELRLLSIPAKPSENSHGVFENIHEFESAELFANYLKDAASNYYGSPLTAFVEKAIDDYSHIKTWYDEAFKASFKKHLPEKASEQDIRAFRVFYFIAFAGELATKYAITGWTEGKALSASLKCFQAWLDNKDGIGNFESKKILEQVKSFIELHGCSRFHDLAGFDSQHINNMAGYKELHQGETIFYLLPTIFKKEICRGINHKDAINLLIKDRILLVNEKGEYYQQKRTPHGNKRVYVIKGELL